MARGPAPRRGAKSAKVRNNSPRLKSRPVDQPATDVLANSSDSGTTSKLTPGLYIVATPIGNLGDVTLRALEVLNSVKLIACEDTRHTGKLLTRYGISTRRTAYHEHNARRALPGLLRLLRGGAAIALVSDAGTPLISDPGYRLVSEAIVARVSIIPVPGPSAPLAALVISGLPSNQFFFVGFLPQASEARQNALRQLSDLKVTLLFLESPRRLAATLEDMAYTLGEREVAIARELTKIHEEVSRGSLAEFASRYRSEAESGRVPRGEVVIVVGPPSKDHSGVLNQGAIKESDKLLRVALQSMGTKKAAETVASATGLSRRSLYARALILINARE